jgi:hypothetical protein
VRTDVFLRDWPFVDIIVESGSRDTCALMSHLTPIHLPDFGDEDERPRISTQEHEQRLKVAVDAMGRAGLDVLVVYADREHSATMAFLTGVEPRFEESILLLSRDDRRQILLGNECLAYAPDPALRIETVLCQHLSLLGQPRDASKPLKQVLRDFGIGKGARVGTVGWKYYDDDAVDDPPHAIEIPAFIVDALRELSGDARLVRNATAIFMNPQDGLRNLNSVDQIAVFEWASIRTSSSALAVLRALREGVRERDLEPLLRGGGLPNSCHPMIMTGDSLRQGLCSPGERRVNRGDPFLVAYGIWGALTARGGMVARGPQDLVDDATREFYARFAANYFDVVALWYERVRVGAVGGEVFDAVDRRRDASLFRFACNPGHTIHLDEWVNSPFAQRDRTVLRSGMALQMDIVPVATGGSLVCANVEDGIILADQSLRSEIVARYPRLWQRVVARRTFMTDKLGIRLDESVLPLSNTPAWLPAYLLDPDRVMVCG